ncbi:MAG: S1 RNA-binding domain-containing protein [Anaerolineae bacterium]|nr:S1 RNA-binding domain-containing protein [Anaerolineae bacterium]
MSQPLSNQHIYLADDPNHPLAFLLEEDLNLNPPNVGEIRTGEIVAIRNNEILVDIGAKSEAIIPEEELEELGKDGRSRLKLGDEIAVLIINPEDDDGNIIVSYTMAAEEQDWQQAHTLLESQEVYSSQVVGYNKGGLLIKVGLLRGFVPISQLGGNIHNSRNAEDLLRQRIGSPISCKVIEVERGRNRLILSEKAAAKEMRSSQRTRLFENLQEGDIRSGRVVNLAPFGIFVDIGGVEGLVHLSELSWRRIHDPSELIKVGDEIQVYVLGVDREQKRIALSCKRLEPDPWDQIDALYQVGQLIEVNITKLTKYGAFACLNDSYQLEGLIHISELAEGHIKHPSDVVQKDQAVTVRIIRINPEQRQLGLSLKKATSQEYLEADLGLAEVENEPAPN